MNRFFKFFKKSLWTFGQPLTKKPIKIGSPVSELFVWRNSPVWKTYFELIDLASLFEEKNFPRKVTFIFFSSDGTPFCKEIIEPTPNKRLTLDLSPYVSKSNDSMGTFCVFHETPAIIMDLGAFITERGYVSYCYKNAPMRSYVHGNLDAISLLYNKKLKMLGAISILKRQYKLQYEFYLDDYEIVLVNSTGSERKVLLKIINTENSQLFKTYSAKLKPREIHIFPVKDANSKKAIITSRMIMARPLLFCFNKQSMRVFHG